MTARFDEKQRPTRGLLMLVLAVGLQVLVGAQEPAGREAALRAAFERFGAAWVARDKKTVAAMVAPDQEGPKPRRFASVFCRYYGIKSAPKVLRLKMEGDLARVDAQVEWAFDLKEEMEDVAPVGTELMYWRYVGGQWRYLYIAPWNPNRQEWEEHCAFLVENMRRPEGREDAEAAVAATLHLVELLRAGDVAAVAEMVSPHRYFSDQEASWEREYNRNEWAARSVKSLTKGYVAWESRRKATYWKAFLTEEKLSKAGGCASVQMWADSFEPGEYTVTIDSTRTDGKVFCTTIHWVKEPEGMRIWRWS